MADTRLPDRWLLMPKQRSLSDAAWRLLTGLLMYSNQQESDGWVDESAYSMCYPRALTTEQLTALFQELEGKGWITQRANGLQILDWAESQTTRAEHENRREKTNQRVKRLRAAKTEDESKSDVTQVVTPLQTPLATQAVGEDRQGKDRQGTDTDDGGLSSNLQLDQPAELTSWFNQNRCNLNDCSLPADSSGYCHIHKNDFTETF